MPARRLCSRRTSFDVWRTGCRSALQRGGRLPKLVSSRRERAMKTTITTSDTPAHDRSRHWHDAIAKAYFPLDLQFREPGPFLRRPDAVDAGRRLALPPHLRGPAVPPPAAPLQGGARGAFPGHRSGPLRSLLLAMRQGRALQSRAASSWSAATSPMSSATPRPPISGC